MRSPADRAGVARPAGFSLFELLIVLVILGFLGAVAAPALGRFVDTLAFRRQISQVVATLRYARLMAVTEGRPVAVTVGEGEPVLVLSGAVSETRSFESDEELRLKMEPERIVFFPEGQVTPATLLCEVGDRRRTILLEPLTGLPAYADEN